MVVRMPRPHSGSGMKRGTVSDLPSTFTVMRASVTGLDSTAAGIADNLYSNYVLGLFMSRSHPLLKLSLCKGPSLERSSGNRPRSGPHGPKSTSRTVPSLKVRRILGSDTYLAPVT